MIYHLKDIQISQLFCQGCVFKFCTISKSFLRIINNKNYADMRATRFGMAMVVEWGHDTMYK
jgi:hypothetical protein